jgi:hypothetical protein
MDDPKQKANEALKTQASGVLDLAASTLGVSVGYIPQRAETRRFVRPGPYGSSVSSDSSASSFSPRGRGHAVVAPNNSGKTTFIRTHPEWLDQDVLLKQEKGLGEKGQMAEDDMKLGDSVTAQHVMAGSNVLVATWWDARFVDAFVIIPQETLEGRDLTDDELTAAAVQADRYRTIAKEHGIPVYSSFEDAARALGVAAAPPSKKVAIAADEDYQYVHMRYRKQYKKNGTPEQSVHRPVKVPPAKGSYTVPGRVTPSPRSAAGHTGGGTARVKTFAEFKEDYRLNKYTVAHLENIPDKRLQMDYDKYLKSAKATQSAHWPPGLSAPAATESAGKGTLKPGGEELAVVQFTPPSLSSEAVAGASVGSGLRNNGNTCYLNAGIQALRVVPAFVEYVGTIAKEARRLDASLSAEADRMTATLHYVLTTDRPAKDAMLSLIPGTLDLGREHDTIEFLTSLLGQVHNCEANLPVHVRATLRNPFDLIVQHTSFTCKSGSCNHKREKAEKIAYLKVNLVGDDGGAHVLSDLINRELSLDGEIRTVAYENGTTCVEDDCIATEYEAKQTVKIWMRPAMIIVYIYRSLNGADKRRDHVFCDREIHLNAGDAKYTLASVVRHTGQNTHHGHLVAQVNKDGIWYKADDTTFIPEEVAGENSTNHPVYNDGENTYIAMYKADDGMAQDLSMFDDLMRHKIEAVLEEYDDVQLGRKRIPHQ